MTQWPPPTLSWSLSVTDPEEIANRDYSSELHFTTSRSSGPGGQHVNKLETRVTLRFMPAQSFVLTEEEKAQLLGKWANQLTQEGWFITHAEKHRSQLQNKQEVLKKFRLALKQAFTKPKPRKPTKPTKASVRKRVDDKKKHAQKKSMRRRPDLD